MRRRQFLASGAVVLPVAVAGCAHPSVVLDMDEATADDVAGAVSITVEPGSEEYPPVSAAIENGSATRSGRYDLFDRTDTVRVGDTFYDVTETRLERSEVTVYEVRVDFDPDNSTAERGEVEYDDLPAVDRERLDRIVSEDVPANPDGYDVGVEYGTAAEVGNESALVPEPRYDVVVHDGDRIRVAVDSRTASEAQYRYTVTEVAADVETFADQVRERYLFELSARSADEREVIAEAIDGGYFEDDDAFRSVAERIREHEGIDVADFYGTWLLSYEDVEYLTYVEW